MNAAAKILHNTDKLSTLLSKVFQLIIIIFFVKS